MRKPIIDLTGKRFGRVTVIDEAGRASYNREVTWRYQCDCGAYGTAASSDLRRGKTAACFACRHIRKENCK